MFESLKRLFRRRTPDEPNPATLERAHAAATRTAPSPATAGKSSDHVAAEDSSPPAGASKDLIQLSLRSVVLKLPETLKDKAKQPPAGGVRIGIPATKILPQLTQGTVRITFGELRKASPPGVFSDSSDRDHTLVDLPLQEILQQLKPDQLPRRLRQKRIEVPDEVVPIFSPQRSQSGVRIATSAPATAPRPKTEPATHGAPRPGSGTITPSVPLPMPSALKGPLSPPAQTPPIRPSTPLPPLGQPSQPPAAARPVTVAPTASVPPLAPAKPAAPAPKPESSPAATTPASGEFISVPLASVTTGWPEPIRHALAGLNAPNATLNLPAEETEQALKRGKVVFSWKRLKPLVRPPLKTALAPALDEVQLELPLPAIAPLFMAQRKTAAPQRKYDVGQDIPDVFSGRGLAAAHVPSAPTARPATPAPAAPAKPVQPISTPTSRPVEPAAAPAPTPSVAPSAAPAPVAASAPAAAPAPAVAPAPAPAKQAAPAAAPAPAPAVAPSEQPAPVRTPAAAAEKEPTDIGEVFGQPGRKNWAPAEIAQRTAGLKGVAGAVVAMQDGLLIAGHLPPGLNGETIAAFLPQLFSRVMQYSKELKFSDSDHVTFIVQNVPLRIYRVGGVYFSVLGREGEPLPETALRLIATHLGPQSK